MGLYDSARSYYHKWGCHFTGRYDKLIAYAIIVCLCTFSILDTCLTWSNYEDLLSDDYLYALVTGHAGQLAVRALFALGVVSSASCLLECVNIVGIMTNGGHVRLPVELEQVVVLLAVGIPTGVVNVSVVLCRHGTATTYQATGGLVTLLKSSLRLYVYGWLKERLFACQRSAYKWTVKIALYLTTTSVLLTVLVVQCFVWHHGHVGGIHSMQTTGSRLAALTGVSVLLVGEHDFDHDDRTRHIGSYFRRTISYCEASSQIRLGNGAGNRTDVRRVLVADISEILERSDGYNATYDCRSIAVMSSCQNSTSLVFRFQYHLNPDLRSRQPFGEVRYGVALLINDTCQPFEHTPDDGWELHYFRIVQDHGSVNDTDHDVAGCVSAHLEQAWLQDCFPPIPHFDPSLNVCG